MKIITQVITALIFLCINILAFALEAPTLSISTSGLDVTASWTSVSGATGYKLNYTPYPYREGNTIESAEMGTAMSFSTTLWDGASYYVAITASDGSEQSGYSNIGQFAIEAPLSKEWTYMVYIAGDNNLSSSAIGDINEMEKVGSSDEVNVVVQVEYSQQYSAEMPANTLRGKIIKDSDANSISTPMTDIGNKDMGDKATLTDFIKWVAQTYPANNYALVLWDHGAGWKVSKKTGGLIKGALEDATSGSFMSLPDLAAAVRDSGVKPDIINFDACLMAMYEVAYEFSGLTDYMVFSEEVEPGEGDPYDTILQKLVDTPTMSALELAQTTTSEFKVYYQNTPRGAITKSTIDMSKIATLHDQLGALAQYMNVNIDTERPNIQSARDSSIKYDYPENHDLGSFLDYLNSTTTSDDIVAQTATVKNTLSSAIVSNDVYSPESNNPISSSSGLAIFLPKRDQVTNDDLNKYAQLAINQSRNGENTWGGFVNQLVTGDTESGPALEKEAGNFIIWLEWDTDADLDLVVWEPDGSFAAPYIGATSPNGFLSEDSYYSGLSVESYAANDQVEAGDYDILVEYWQDGPLTYGSTTASIYIKDLEAGDHDFGQPTYQRSMDLSNLAPVNWMESEAGVLAVWNEQYSDWWYPGYLTRSTKINVSLGELGRSTRIGNKTFNIRMSPTKKSKNKYRPSLLPEELQVIKEKFKISR